MTVRPAALAVAAVIALSTLTACTSSASSGHGAAATVPGSVADAPPSDSPLSTDSPTHNGSITPTIAPPTSSASTGISLPKDTCTAAQLTIRALRGGAVPSQEIALITFTNSSHATCEMFGFPGVSLRAKGHQVGSPASRSPVGAKSVKLLPGEQAEAQVTDFISCEAPLSDTVRIYAPNLTTFVDKPLELRACRFEVDPVSHSS